MYILWVVIAFCAGWASRTYFSDNGSTAIEIALKMAFRKFSSHHGSLSNLLNDDSTQSRAQLMVRNINSCIAVGHVVLILFNEGMFKYGLENSARDYNSKT